MSASIVPGIVTGDPRTVVTVTTDGYYGTVVGAQVVGGAREYVGRLRQSGQGFHAVDIYGFGHGVYRTMGDAVAILAGERDRTTVRVVGGPCALCGCEEGQGHLSVTHARQADREAAEREAAYRAEAEAEAAEAYALAHRAGF